MMSAIDGEGNLLTAGGSAENLDGDRGGVSGNNGEYWICRMDGTD